MIEARLSLAEARWLLALLGLDPSGDSPLKDSVALAGEVPPGSTAETKMVQSLTERGFLVADRAVNPFLSAALLWLARPEKAWDLSLFGPGGAEVLHLAFRGDAAVECRWDSSGIRLRFPLPVDEARHWLSMHLDGGNP